MAQAAERLGCKPGLIYQLVAARKLRHCRLGNGRGILRIPSDAIDEYLNAVMVAPKKDESIPTTRVKLKHLHL